MLRLTASQDFSPVAAGEWNRANVAAYLESEITPLKHWLVALAGRFEDFEDFGQTFNYKVATNIGVTDFLEDAGMIGNDEMILKFRGSFSTGFRATDARATKRLQRNDRIQF